MKRTTTEILVEVEEMISVRLQKQNSPALESEVRETTGEQIVCPFCERAFAVTTNTKQKSEE